MVQIPTRRKAPKLLPNIKKIPPMPFSAIAAAAKRFTCGKTSIKLNNNEKIKNIKHVVDKMSAQSEEYLKLFNCFGVQHTPQPLFTYIMFVIRMCWMDIL